MGAPRYSFLLAPALTAALLWAGPSPAGADPTPPGTLTLSRACYVNTAKALAQITVSGHGWQAGATLELTDQLERITATATAGADGSFSAHVPAPVVDPTKPQISDAIRVAYENDPGLPGTTSSGTASASFLTTDYAVRVTGSTSRSPRRIYELSGFKPGRTVYAHYLNRVGKLLTSVSFGKPGGVCGVSRVVRPQYPAAHPQPGSYTVQFDNARTYTRFTQPAYRFSFQIRAAQERLPRAISRRSIAEL